MTNLASQNDDPLNLRNLVETIPALVVCALSDGTVEFVNRSWQEYAGYSPEQLSDSGWRSIIQGDDFARFLDAWTVALSSGRRFEIEARVKGADGQYRWFLIKTALAVSGARNRGPALHTLIAFEDIQERKNSQFKLQELQADLAHVNRVSTMGELTAALAHEIKQPIGAAVTNAEACLRFLDRDRPDVAEAREAAFDMVRESRRVADVVERVRSLYQKQSPQLDVVDVNEFIREMVIVLHHEADRHSITMRTKLSEGLPKVMADRVQLQQVLMNLVLNGIEAMRDAAGELSVRSQLSDDGQVLISVTDAGVGLPAGKADQIFNAFFTTKTGGTGLGLAITRSIVESHGGRVWATANSGRGATFQFTLPQHRRPHA